jgi:phospholipid transport system substrate-binding protein
MIPALVLAAAAATASIAPATPEDQSAIATVASFDDALLASMHQDAAPLRTTIASAFNVPVMAATIVGQSWKDMTDEEHRSVAAALQRYLLARFASEFDAYHGEQFRIEPEVQTRGQDKLVRTRVAGQSGEATQLYYRLRYYQGSWRIIDVYYDGISQLATQRADLAAVAADPPALIAQIERVTAAIH